MVGARAKKNRRLGPPATLAMARGCNRGGHRHERLSLGTANVPADVARNARNLVPYNFMRGRGCKKADENGPLDLLLYTGKTAAALCTQASSAPCHRANTHPTLWIFPPRETSVLCWLEQRGAGLLQLRPRRY